MAASSKKNLHCHDSSVMAPINKCFFVPYASYENPHYGETTPDGKRLSIFKASRGGHYRAIVQSSDLVPLAGVIYNAQGGIVYKEAADGQEKALAGLVGLAGVLLGKRLYCANELDV
jgi:hypothetical protein